MNTRMSEAATLDAAQAGVLSEHRAMKITFKLYASLTDYLPADRRVGNRMPLDVAPESTIAQIIEPFSLPMSLVHLVLINGVFVPPGERATRTLSDGDVLAIWPPIAGG
jgi:sulfur carrier protein ThiS